MDMDVKGQDNRVAGRDYIELNLKDEDKSKPLTKVQRDHLNALVYSICTEFDKESWSIWKHCVHRVLGVNSIDEITQAQYPLAVDELKRNVHEKKALRDKQAIMDRINTIVSDRSISAELQRHMLYEFGKTDINDLERDDLLKTLRYVEYFDSTALPNNVKNSTGLLRRLNYELAIGVTVGAILTAMFYEYWVIPSLV